MSITDIVDAKTGQKDMIPLDYAVINSGNGYELRRVTYIDHNGITREAELFHIQGQTGIDNAYRYGGLPLSEKMEMEAELDEWGGDWDPKTNAYSKSTQQINPEEVTWIINAEVAALKTYQEEMDYIKRMGLEDIVLEEQGASAKNNKFIICHRRWRYKSKSYSKSIDETLSKNHQIGGNNAYIDFEGNIDIDADIDLDLTYRYKRTRFGCIPKRVSVTDLDLKSNYEAAGSFELTGVAKHNFGDFKWEIAKPKVLDKWFMVGPVPVRIAMKVPIEIGTGDIKVRAEGQVALVKPVRFRGHFNYKCNLGSCTRDTSNHFDLNDNLTNSLGASISAKLSLAPYVHVAARPYVYGEWFLYAQVGVKPNFPIEVFGYYGNLCGDGDNDGTREWVNAGLGTLEFEVGITGEVRIFRNAIFGPRYWRVWNKPLLFFDFLNPGSTAFSPELRPTVNSTTRNVSLPISIRSCVDQYTGKFPQDYRVFWGDGGYSNVNDIANAKTVSHQYASPGTYNIKVEYKPGVHTIVPITIEGDDDDDGDWGGDW